MFLSILSSLYPFSPNLILPLRFSSTSPWIIRVYKSLDTACGQALFINVTLTSQIFHSCAAWWLDSRWNKKKPIWWWYCNGPGPLWGQVCLFGQVAALNTVHSGTHGTEQMKRAQGTLHSRVIIRRAGKCFVAMLGSPTDQKNIKDKLPTPSLYGQRTLHPRLLLISSS